MMPGWIPLTRMSPISKALLQPYPAEEIQAHLVNPKVGNVRNDESSLAELFPNSA